MKPHIHAEVIKAWADGAEIEYRHPTAQTWATASNPQWIIENEYRIKPEEKKPVVRWLWASKSGRISQKLYTEYEVVGAKENLFVTKLEWSKTEFPE